MCLKLKNKILQVIEIISNYGLIFAIYKFILFEKKIYLED